MTNYVLVAYYGKDFSKALPFHMGLSLDGLTSLLGWRSRDLVNSDDISAKAAAMLIPTRKEAHSVPAHTFNTVSYNRFGIRSCFHLVYMNMLLVLFELPCFQSAHLSFTEHLAGLRNPY